MRAAEERLRQRSPSRPCLRDNLFWARNRPALHLADCGVQPCAGRLAAGRLSATSVAYRLLGASLGVSKAEWLKLAERRRAAAGAAEDRSAWHRGQPVLGCDEAGFERLYDLFARALVGSLINPRAGGDLVEHGFATPGALLAQVMAKAETRNSPRWVAQRRGLAKGGADSRRYRFTLVATNVPYLGRGKAG